jgi:lipoprotein-anchoring transpeptidase ErfK/SrfK
MHNHTAYMLAGLTLGLVTACSDTSSGETKPPPPAKSAAQSAPAAVVAPPVQSEPAAASASPEAQAIDASGPAAPGGDPVAMKRGIIRAQILLDRAHFSPGVIDGQAGENLRQAVAALEKARGLPVDGQLDAEVWTALTGADAAPAMQDYAITEADVAGPFTATIPQDPTAMSKLEQLGYSGPLELLAEKFHMDERLLKALNPAADFAKAGTVIIVAGVADRQLPAKVARIEVDKAEREVRAYGADKALLAVYPATVGSADRPAPTGEWAVRTIAPNPTWTLDPSRLTFGDAKAGKLTIKAGPNNPVGAMWIDLTKETYGIHGTPDPRRVGKAESHGCVRLTNWDAIQLGRSVEKGAKVVFTGAETPAGKASSATSG